MKYFSPELFVGVQLPSEEDMDAADAAWETAVDSYAERLRGIRPQMPDHIQKFLDGLLLHDADVLSMARRDNEFSMVLRKDIPPRDLVFLPYTLATEPVVNKSA